MAKNAKSLTESRGLTKPLCFVENKGEVVDEKRQFRKDIDYKLSTPGMSLYIGAGQLQYQFVKAEGTGSSAPKVTAYHMDVTLAGANLNAQPQATEKQDYYENYYMDGYNSNGFTAHSWNKITYKDIYPNIDWVLYVKDGKVEYDFNVRPGGKISDIKLVYGGSTSLKINKDGSLGAKTPLGSISEKAPYAFEAGTGRQVAANFRLKNNTVTFEAGKCDGTLVIDPTLLWSTYFGGTGLDVATCITISPGGLTYVGGYTASVGLTLPGAPFMSTNQGGVDAFMAQYSATGVLQYATYVGGAGADRGHSIAIESLGANVYLAGSTTSNPAFGVLSTPGAYHTANMGGVDGFLIKFNNVGARQWCTFYGGPGTDSITCVTVDGANNVIIGGQTTSTASIASSATVYQPGRNGASDAFLAKFDAAGTVQWSTYYGGTSTDAAMGVTTNAAGDIFVAGQTSSVTDMATGTSFQPSLRGTNDAFLAMFNAGGTRSWGTYFGGTGLEIANGVACDPVSGALAIVGNTSSVNFIASSNVHQTAFGGIQDAFVASFDQTGSRLWSTYYGGTQFDYGEDVSFDPFSNVAVTGGTFSPSSIANTFSSQPAIGGDYDAYIALLNPLGQRLAGTYFGGTFYDYATGIAVDRSVGQIFISGHTTSLGTYGSGGIVSAGAAQTTYGGGTYDAFISKFECHTFGTLDQPFTDTLVCAGGTLQVPYSVYPATSTFNPGNVFSIEMSDVTGSFASPTVIGSATTTTGGIITCTIPAGTPVGIGYRIRLVATNPVYVSPDSYYDIRVVSSIASTVPYSNSPICVNGTLNLNDTANYTIMSWSWTGPAGFISALQNPSRPLVTLAHAGVYTVTTVHNGCPPNTATTTVVINDVIPPTPNISGANGCAGYTLALTSDPDTVTTDPIYYSWVGPAGFTSTLQNPSIVGATTTNTGYYFVHDILNGCPSADTFVYVTVSPVVPVSITIAANSPYIPGRPGDTICAGQTVNFNAFPVNGGAAPSFQWYTGVGSPVIGAISSTWSSSTLLEGQTVFCTLNSSVPCPSPLTATSNGIKMNVISNTPTVYISASPGLHVTPGSNITFTSYVYNGGIAPTYQWTKNGVVIPGATNDTYTLVGVTKVDTIALTVTSTMACVANPINTSNQLVIMTNVGVTNLSAALSDVSLFPNPNNGSFNIKGELESAGIVELEVTNMLGQVVYSDNAVVQNTTLNHTIAMPKTANGIYLLRVNKDGDSKIFRFVVER